MIGFLGDMLGGMFSGASAGGIGTTAQPETVTVDVGPITPTVGGGAMNLLGSTGWIWLVVIFAGLYLLRRKRL